MQILTRSRGFDGYQRACCSLLTRPHMTASRLSVTPFLFQMRVNHNGIVLLSTVNRTTTASRTRSLPSFLVSILTSYSTKPRCRHGIH